MNACFLSNEKLIVPESLSHFDGAFSIIRTPLRLNAALYNLKIGFPYISTPMNAIVSPAAVNLIKSRLF